MANMKSPRIVVLDGDTLHHGDVPWEPVARLAGELILHDRTPADQIAARCADADIVVTNKAPLTVESIAQLPKLKLIAVTATGYNIVDVVAAAARGIVVSNVPEYGTDTVAQYTFALLLELCHHVGRHAQTVRNGDWSRSADWCYWLTPQVELAGRTMGIVGFGCIGRRVGELAHAFGMRVLAHAPRQINAPSYAPFAWARIEELFRESDVITLHAPQTPETTGMVNARLLSLARPSTFLINAARGGLVNEPHLADALNQDVIAGAAIDVVSAEPIRPDNPLLTAKNCLITPHMAWASIDARRRIMQTTADNIAAFLNGRPINVVSS
jgi:glycerate dehydrogenase